MTSSGSRPAAGRIVAGFILLGLGAIFLLDNFGLVEAREVLRFWPAILLAMGLTRLLAPGRAQDRGAGVVLTVVGAVFLLRALHVPWFRLRLVWPGLLLVLGAALIWQAIRGRRGLRPGLSGVGDDASRGAAAGLEPTRGLSAGPGPEGAVLKEFALMGGGDRVVTSQDFRGGEVTAIMGGFQIDLRGAGHRGRLRDTRDLHGVRRRRAQSAAVLEGDPLRHADPRRLHGLDESRPRRIGARQDADRARNGHHGRRRGEELVGAAESRSDRLACIPSSLAPDDSARISRPRFRSPRS